MLAHMPEQFITQPRIITSLTARILKLMLENPRADYYVEGMAAELGNPGASISPHMKRLEAAGWVTRRISPGYKSGRARHNFKFTKAGEAAARKELKTWTFTD